MQSGYAQDCVALRFMVEVGVLAAMARGLWEYCSRYKAGAT